MDISFQPKSQAPEESKVSLNVAQAVSGIKALYVGDHKSFVTIAFTILPFIIGGAIFAMMAVNSSLAADISNQKLALDAEDKKVVSVPMKDIKQLSDRIQIVSQVINNQAFMTSFLKILEYSVEDDVIFQKTTLATINTSGRVTYSFSIDAKASTYSSVLNQFQTLRDQSPYNKYFSNVKMQNFAVDKKGQISFKILGDISVKGLTPEDAEFQLSGKANIVNNTRVNEAQATSSQITSSSTTP